MSGASSGQVLEMTRAIREADDAFKAMRDGVVDLLIDVEMILLHGTPEERIAAADQVRSLRLTLREVGR